MLSLPEAALQIYIIAGQEYPNVGIEPDAIHYLSIITGLLSSAKNVVNLWLRPTMKTTLQGVKNRSSIRRLIERENQNRCRLTYPKHPKHEIAGG